jgi:site-specific DNA-methyltransferase (adenine-specific)
MSRDLYQWNTAQHGDALELLQSLANGCTPLAFFDPQHRGVLDYLKFGNEGAKQRGRSELPAMTDAYIEQSLREIARVLKASAYAMVWIDTYNLCEAFHLRVADVLKLVDLITWDSGRFCMGKRTRRCADYVLVIQKQPISASNWRDHGIRNRWSEKVDYKLHPHIKPIGLTARLIAAVTAPNDLIVDPAAGSFMVLRAALSLNRNFIGVDIAFVESADGYDAERDIWTGAEEAYRVIRERMRNGGPGWVPAATPDKAAQ